MATDQKSTAIEKAPAKRPSEGGFLRDALRIAMAPGAALITAYYYITSRASHNFSEQGHFDVLDREMADSIRATPAQELVDSIKSLSSDGEGGYYINGVVNKLHNEYAHGKERIFAEHGVESVVDKYNKVLTAAQRNKTLVFSSIAAAVAGAFVYSAAKSHKKEHEHDEHCENCHADRVKNDAPAESAKLR
ncbi:MAG: hypothetical protein SFT92_09825 [Rickettsiales bacterium]|nr:hypothetical protein [Rickettsiales bacterium]